jgi:hypothetical protein
MRFHSIAFLTWITMTQADDCRVITGKDLTDPKAPNLSSYLVAKPEQVPNPRLDISTSPAARRYRTVFRQQVQKGPNFAGHYRVVVWGCGSSCASFAVVNLKTGRVLDVEGAHSMSGVDFEVGDFLTGTDSEDTTFRYRKDSKLLIAIGAPDEDAARGGVFYYLLGDERLKVIHFTPAKKTCP